MVHTGIWWQATQGRIPVFRQCMSVLGDAAISQINKHLPLLHSLPRLALSAQTYHPSIYFILYSHILNAGFYILQSCNSIKYVLCMNMVSFRFPHATIDMEFLSLPTLSLRDYASNNFHQKFFSCISVVKLRADHVTNVQATRIIC